MGLTVASYNVCQAINQGTFQVSVSGSASLGQSAGDPCNNCGEYVYSNPSSTSSVSMSITIPFSSLIYNPQNLWMVVMGKYVTNVSEIDIEFAFYDVSGNQIGSEVVSPTQNVGATPCGSTSFANIYCYIITSPVPNGTDSIVLSVSSSVPGGYIFQFWFTDIYFYSQPPVYYIEPLFFYNQTLTYSVPLNITTSDYLALWIMSGSPSGLNSYSACVSTSNGTPCANYMFFSGESSVSAFQVTGNANNTYQVTWSQELALIFVNSSCGLDNIFLFEVTGYNNILNPSEYTFIIQTPFNGSVSKTYTLLIPVGYFKLLPSYSLSCSTSPCTSGFTTFTITVDIQTSSGVVIASQQVDVLSGQTFTTFNLEDYYGGQTLDVVITLNIDATLSQTVTLTMNFEYEVLAQT